MGTTSKPGSSTSEHKAMWAVILTSVAAGIGAVAAIPALPVAITIAAAVLASSLASAGYSISRGLAKSGDSGTPPAPPAP